jgi:hypothetical protein
MYPWRPLTRPRCDYRGLALRWRCCDYWLRGNALESLSAGCRRTFLRLSFCANLLLSRFFSPGFRKKECRFTSLIMPSCWTCRLKRRRALSMDSPSKIRTSAKMYLREICDKAVGMGVPKEMHPCIRCWRTRTSYQRQTAY